MGQFESGSEWRKWDLHLHIPGTSLNDNYKGNGSEVEKLDKYVDLLETSDVYAFGLTDYFRADRTLNVIEHYRRRFPESAKLLLVNIELRLDLSLNKAQENINTHIIFDSSTDRVEIERFLRNLKLNHRKGVGGRVFAASDLSETNELKSATVSLESLRSAIAETFGEEIADRTQRRKKLLIVTSAKNDGNRPAPGNGFERRFLLGDEVDKFSDAFFGNSGNVEYFLNTNRYEDASIPSDMKPVYDGCDAHSFEDLQSRLGVHSDIEGKASNTLWIKADPTYLGLLQTLIEPKGRVAIQATKPDSKDDYKIIDYVSFPSGSGFPSTIKFNPGLNSIIGSRSSGKSSLLAHIAHAVDPARTVRSQLAANPNVDERQLGPAPGFTWGSDGVPAAEIVWHGHVQGEGSVVYVPQNALFALSTRREEITNRIIPTIAEQFPSWHQRYLEVNGERTVLLQQIRHVVIEWREKYALLLTVKGELKELGDAASINAELDRLRTEAADLSLVAGMTESDARELALLQETLAKFHESIRSFEMELVELGIQAGSEVGSNPTHIGLSFTLNPSADVLPDALARGIQSLVANLRDEGEAMINQVVQDRVDYLLMSLEVMRDRFQRVRDEGAGLLEKEALAAGVTEKRKSIERISGVLRQIGKKTEDVERLSVAMKVLVDDLDVKIKEYLIKVEKFAEDFSSDSVEVDGIAFNAESGGEGEILVEASSMLHGSYLNDYIKEKGDDFNFKSARDNLSDFLYDVAEQRIRLKSSASSEDFMIRILSTLPTLRYSATLDGDTIGGFGPSSMTPGKQALFALTLLLGSDGAGWPLLLDQPEDDLDSRSIFESIVPYLMEQKSRRQIIMVTHNANLVVGADSEMILVANRHGSDRPNRNDLVFDYFGGSIEFERPAEPGAVLALDRHDVRGHACELLDGGPEAFEKRSVRYSTTRLIRSPHPDPVSKGSGE